MTLDGRLVAPDVQEDDPDELTLRRALEGRREY